MKKISALTMTAALLFCLSAAPAFSADLPDIMKKIIDAQGGKKLLESIKDIKVTGKLDIVSQGISGTLTNVWKEPNQRRIDIEVMGMVIRQAYDGETAWWFNPATGAVEDMPEDQADAMINEALGFSSLLYPEKYGITYTLKENEVIEGKEYIVIGVEYANGEEGTAYIDPETYLTHHTISTSPDGMGGEVEVISYNSDYRTVDGFVIGFKTISFRDGIEFMSLNIEKVEINTGVENDYFKKQ